jgi:hypothetical protein
MAKADLEEFYALVAVGDTVELVGERNEETALLFGGGQDLAAPQAAQPMQTAMAAVDAGPLQAVEQAAILDANIEARAAAAPTADAGVVAAK